MRLNCSIRSRPRNRGRPGPNPSSAVPERLPFHTPRTTAAAARQLTTKEQRCSPTLQGSVLPFKCQLRKLLSRPNAIAPKRHRAEAQPNGAILTRTHHPLRSLPLASCLVPAAAVYPKPRRNGNQIFRQVFRTKPLTPAFASLLRTPEQSCCVPPSSSETKDPPFLSPPSFP